MATCMCLNPSVYTIKKSIINYKLDLNRSARSNESCLCHLQWSVHSMNSKHALVPAAEAQAISIRLLWAFFIFMAGAKSEPVKNNYAGCQQLQRLFQHTPMPQQTARRTQISHKIKVKVKKKSSDLVCWSLSVGTSDRLLSLALHPRGFMQSSPTESLSWTHYIWISRRVFAETAPGEPR